MQSVIKKLLCRTSTIAALAFAAAVSPAHAQLIDIGFGGVLAPSENFFTGVRLGTDLNDQDQNIFLDSASGLTDPTFNLTVGQSLLLSANVFGAGPTFDEFIFTVTGIGAASDNFVFVPYTGGGNTYKATLTFNEIGSFNGSAFADLLFSSSDYNRTGAPGGLSATDGKTFTFNVNVAGVSAVP